MLIRQGALIVIGLASGFAVSSGIFAFITMLGIVPRLAARTHTATRIKFYENSIIIGGALGNLFILFQLPFPVPGLMEIFGCFAGIFVGCLAMALAEMLRVIPIFIKRLNLVKGLPLMILVIALGKFVGVIFQYFY